MEGRLVGRRRNVERPRLDARVQHREQTADEGLRRVDRVVERRGGGGRGGGRVYVGPQRAAAAAAEDDGPAEAEDVALEGEAEDEGGGVRLVDTRRLEERERPADEGAEGGGRLDARERARREGAEQLVRRGADRVKVGHQQPQQPRRHRRAAEVVRQRVCERRARVLRRVRGVDGGGSVGGLPHLEEARVELEGEHRPLVRRAGVERADEERRVPVEPRAARGGVLALRRRRRHPLWPRRRRRGGGGVELLELALEVGRAERRGAQPGEPAAHRVDNVLARVGRRALEAQRQEGAKQLHLRRARRLAHLRRHAHELERVEGELLLLAEKRRREE